MNANFKKIGFCLGCLGLGMGSVANAAKEKHIERFADELRADKALEGHTQLGDLHVVDCLLPGQVRRLGNRTYLSPRRPVKTTASDCRIKGGEYVEYDRADYRSALNVWMAAAEAGDPEAQTNVGEIFERGHQGNPNFEAARIWYEKAAAQDYGRAQFNLGTLYEQGLGVSRNPVTALNWYRQAWGMADDDVIFASAAAKQQQQMQAQYQQELAQRVATKDRQIASLQTQLRKLREALEASTDEQAAADQQLDDLQNLLSELQDQQAAQRVELAQLTERPQVGATDNPDPQALVLREPGDDDASAVVRPPVDPTAYKDVDMGNYYALLIGNAEYEQMENLETPLNDIARAHRILEEKYGFTVFSLTNGSNVSVMKAINDLSEILTEDDNLLLFYAGHGSRLNRGDAETGFWLPKNAERPPRNTYWVPNEFITGHLARLQAKRVLVVADSCYAGLLSAEPSLLLFGNDRPEYSNLDFLRFKLGKRARLLLTSGGDRPVLDSGAGQHSVFASAFLDELETNQGLLASPELYLRIRDRVSDSAAAVGFEQRPELKTIKSAGHEVGDFFFVPRDIDTEA